MSENIRDLCVQCGKPATHYETSKHPKSGEEIAFALCVVCPVPKLRLVTRKESGRFVGFIADPAFGAEHAERVGRRLSAAAVIVEALALQPPPLTVGECSFCGSPAAVRRQTTGVQYLILPQDHAHTCVWRRAWEWANEGKMRLPASGEGSQELADALNGRACPTDATPTSQVASEFNLNLQTRPDKTN